MLIGNNSYEISDIFNFIDKENKNQIDYYEIELFLHNLLEFSFNEKKRSAFNSIDTEETEENLENDIENFINSFIEKIYKNYDVNSNTNSGNLLNFNNTGNLYSNNINNDKTLTKESFINIFMNNKDLKEELITVIRKTEDFIFSKVFRFNLTHNENKNFIINNINNDNNNINNDDDDSKSK
jgi:hypothetical protein